MLVSPESVHLPLPATPHPSLAIEAGGRALWAGSGKAMPAQCQGEVAQGPWHLYLQQLGSRHWPPRAQRSSRSRCPV